MRRYLLSFDAQHDLVEIRAYYKQQAGARVAFSVLQEISKAFALLAANPGIVHLRTDLADSPIKFWQVFSYLIVYHPQTKPIHILRVLHSARDIANHLERKD